MNQFVLVCRLTRDPELHQTQTGKMVTTITLAVRKNIKKENLEQSDTNFIPITAWGIGPI
ncbi:single-stranded DNA-binding protein [Pectinatus frisingensis]|uniref:single-stranded DNA-binding protein n=1 Tax=Pectinatus frisingensis TaxID=865 RepID=UPI0018C85347|nr:single-stranded DNA-binding protein [Pectinatus frisingensis]